MKTKRKVKSKKVSKNFSGETTLKQLPDNTYFKTVGKDGKLSKSTYIKPKRSWNPFSRRYDICNVNDVGSQGIEMKLIKKLWQKEKKIKGSLIKMGNEVNKRKHYHTVIMYKTGRIDKYYRVKKEDADGMYLMLKGLYPNATFHFGEEDIDVSK